MPERTELDGEVSAMLPEKDRKGMTRGDATTTLTLTIVLQFLDDT